ncbi:MAG: recombinase family protein [Bacilli bacterium]
MTRRATWCSEFTIGMSAARWACKASPTCFRIGGIPTPGQISGQKNASSYLNLSTVRTILTNPAYIGDLVAQREHVATLGSTRRKETSLEERVVVRNTHPPLISPDLFDAVQRLQNRRSRQHMPGEPNLFTHLLICADCGKGMSCVKRDYGNTHYVCTTHLKRGAHLCSRHAIREAYLERGPILTSLKRLTREQVDAERLIADARRESEKQKKREKKHVESLKDRIGKLEKRKSAAEDKWLDGEWNKDRYHAALEWFESELLELRR